MRSITLSTLPSHIIILPGARDISSTAPSQRLLLHTSHTKAPAHTASISIGFQMADIKIRPATEADMPHVAHISRHYVINTVRLPLHKVPPNGASSRS